MTEQSLEERVLELEDRVSFLEDEIGKNLSEARFEHKIRGMFNHEDDVEIEFNHGAYRREDHFARVQPISVDKLNRIMDRFERLDEYGFSVIENSNGLGVEIWTETFK